MGARYDSLPVYREAYDLIVYFNNLSVNLARDMRYTIAEDLKRCLIAVEVAVYRANAGSGVCRPPVVGFLSGRHSRRPKPARPPARSALGFHAPRRPGLQQRHLLRPLKPIRQTNQ